MIIAGSFFHANDHVILVITFHFISYQMFFHSKKKDKKLYSVCQIKGPVPPGCTEPLASWRLLYWTLVCNGRLHHRPRKPIGTARAWKYNQNVNAFGTSTTEPSTEHYPVPVSSEFGGVLSISHTVIFSSHRSSSAPSSSQSWSPLHTRDLLMHWPKSEQKCTGKIRSVCSFENKSPKIKALIYYIN